MSNILEQPLKYLRARVATGNPAVDRNGGNYGFGMISGVSIITRGEALGHDLWIDTEFLQSTADAINARSEGLKARFTHPGMSGDGLGTMLGKVTDARVAGNQVVGDLHFVESATKAPDGNLADYVMTLAEDTPEDFVIATDRTPRIRILADGGVNVVSLAGSIANSMGANDRGREPSRSMGLGSTLSLGAGPRRESSLAWDAGTAPRKRMPVARARAAQRMARVSGTMDGAVSAFMAFMFMRSFRFISWGKVGGET